VDSLDCGACGRQWSTHDGLYDFKEPLAIAGT
jgi:hypothetical protein